MEFLIELLANLLLLFGIYLVRWCAVHKDTTKAILVVAVMIVDVIFIIKHFW